MAEPDPVDGNGPAADAERADAALAVTPVREDYPPSPAPAAAAPSAAAREMPAEHGGHEMAAREGAPSPQEMMGHGGAAGMSMDAIVADMRNRFLVAAIFSVPILLWSPIRRSVLGFRVAAPFGLRDDVWLLLSLPVIFYSSWIFFDGAACRRAPSAPEGVRADRPCRNRTLALTPQGYILACLN